MYTHRTGSLSDSSRVSPLICLLISSLVTEIKGANRSRAPAGAGNREPGADTGSGSGKRRNALGDVCRPPPITDPLRELRGFIQIQITRRLFPSANIFLCRLLDNVCLIEDETLKRMDWNGGSFSRCADVEVQNYLWELLRQVCPETL